MISTTDVTELVVSRLHIEEQRSLLNTIFSSSPDLIWYKKADGRYLAVNPRFASIAGMTPEEVVGKKTIDLFPEAPATI